MLCVSMYSVIISSVLCILGRCYMVVSEVCCLVLVVGSVGNV